MNFINFKNLIKIINLSLVLTLALSLTGCGSSVYESSKDGYTKVTNIEGVTFETPSSWATKATAISSIKDDDYYDGLFVTKTESSYILFDMSEALVVCGESKFDWKANDTTVDNLKAHDIENIWFTSEDKLKYDHDTKNGAYKLIADANADYSVTPTQYASFTGYLATVKTDAGEWSIFAGAVTEYGKLNSTQEKMLKHIVKSFSVSEEAESISVEEAVDNIPEEEKTPAKEAITEPVVEETPVEETEDTTEETEAVVTDDSSEEDEVVVVDEGEDEVTDTASSETNEATATEDAGENTSEEEPVVEETKEEVEAADTHYDSTPLETSTFKPVEIGKTALVNVIDNAENMTLATVRAEEIITGSEAAEFVNTYGRKKTLTEGTEFVVLKYSASVDPTVNYIDCKFLGVDGENLNHLGVAYVSRCYDVYSKMEERKGEYTNIYLYYEVPVGTREYLLTFGYKSIQDAGADIVTANYHVSTGYKAVNPREKR